MFYLGQVVESWPGYREGIRRFDGFRYDDNHESKLECLNDFLGGDNEAIDGLLEWHSDPEREILWGNVYDGHERIEEGIANLHHVLNADNLKEEEWD